MNTWPPLVPNSYTLNSHRGEFSFLCSHLRDHGRGGEGEGEKGGEEVGGGEEKEGEREREGEGGRERETEERVGAHIPGKAFCLSSLYSNSMTVGDEW